MIQSYNTNPLPSRDLRRALATDLGVNERNVQIWFQNRRQREEPTALPRPSSRPSPPVSTETQRSVVHAVESPFANDIRFLATSIDVWEDAFDDEHVSSISVLVGVDTEYVRCVLEDHSIVTCEKPDCFRG